MLMVRDIDSRNEFIQEQKKRRNNEGEQSMVRTKKTVQRTTPHKFLMQIPQYLNEEVLLLLYFLAHSLSFR